MFKKSLFLATVLTSFAWGDAPQMPSKDATLSARTCIDSSGFYVTGDFIYWLGRTEELFFVGDISRFEVDANGNILSRGKGEEVNFQYDPGFKLGVGGNLPFDGWDLYLNWTHLHNHPSTSLSSPTPRFFPLFGSEDAGELVVGTHAKGSWDVMFNSLDLDWGRLLYLSRTLYLRPSFGVKAAWLNQEIRFSLQNNEGISSGNVVPNMSLKANNDYWGVGPYFALNGVWNWGWGFGLYGQISGALLWGQFKQDLALLTILNTQNGTTLDTATTSRSHRVRPTLQMFAGLDWRSCVYRGWLALNFRAGWEVQYYWSQLLNAFGGIQESDLSFEGLTITGRIEF